MSIEAKKVIRLASDLLSDSASVRWTVDRLVRYLNAGQREISTVRPDAFLVEAELTLQQGSRQVIPVEGEKFVRLVNNATGSMREILPADAQTISSLEPRWRSARPVAEILHWMADVRNPASFEVYPPAAEGVKVDGEYIAKVVDIAEPTKGLTYSAVTGSIPLRENFVNALVDYILFACHAEGTQYAQPQRAILHRQAFDAALGNDAKGTAVISTQA